MDYEEVYKRAHNLGYMEGVVDARKEEARLVKSLRTFLEVAKEVIDREELPYDAMGDYSLELQTKSVEPTHVKHTETNGVCSSCISRQAAIEAMAPFDTNHELRDTLDALPPVEPKRPEGEWVLKEHLWECDQCGCRINRAEPLKGNIWNYNFCPNCGADMRGDKE